MRHYLTFGAILCVASACGGTSTIGQGTSAASGKDGGSTGGTASNTGGEASTGGAESTGGEASTGGTENTGGTTSTGGISSTGGTAGSGGSVGTGGQSGVCKEDADCPPAPPMCYACADGSCHAKEAACTNGKCGFVNRCPGVTACSTDRDCPIPPMACKPCADGSCANAWTHCISGGCSSGYDACTSGTLTWYKSCGDPVCREPSPPSGLSPCDPNSGQKVGEPCAKDGELCDGGDGCGVHLVCAASDPTHGGVCPKSRAQYKQDIEYVSREERNQLASALQSIPLVHYRYKGDTEREHLGFIIEDIEPSPSVDAKRDQVDLYGYTSMAVAALQEQHAEIEALKREVQSLKAALQKRTQSAK